MRKVVLTDGIFDCKKNPGIQKIIVMEHHKATGKIGKALIENYDLQGGAVATTLAHDSRTEFEYHKKTGHEPVERVRLAYRNKKEESYNRQQADTLLKKGKMPALHFAKSIMRLP